MRMGGLGILLGCLLATPFTHALAKELRSSDNEPLEFPTVQAVAYMGELIRERTGGRHSIGSLGAGSKNSELFTIAALRNGTLDMARLSASAFNNAVPATGVASLPFLFRSPAHARRILDGPIGAEILAALDSQGLVGLCFYDTGMRSVYSIAKPIRNTADIKRLNVRVQPSNMWVAVVRALGATATSLPYNRVQAALASRTIDAAENNLLSYEGSGHYRVAKYYSLTEHSAAPAMVVFSKKVWSGFSTEDQEIIRDAARESVGHLRKLWEEHETAARARILASGGEIIADIDRKSFSDVLEPLHPVLVQEPALQELVKRIKATD